jgi:hypothetical protein
MLCLYAMSRFQVQFQPSYVGGGGGYVEPEQGRYQAPTYTSEFPNLGPNGMLMQPPPPPGPPPPFKGGHPSMDSQPYLPHPGAGFVVPPMPPPMSPVSGHLHLIPSPFSGLSRVVLLPEEPDAVFL